MSIKTAFFATFLLAATTLVPAASAAEKARLTGVVTLAGSQPLPEGGTVTVALDDVSLADAPAVTLGSASFPVGSKAPIGYTIHYDADHIQAGHRYALHAEIRRGPTLLFMTKAATINTAAVPDDTTLVVAPVSDQLPDELIGEWTITRIGTRAVNSARIPAFLGLSPDGAVSGTGGCNRMMGHAVASGVKVNFGPIASTRMACPGDRMKQEDAVFGAIETVTGWRREGSILLLNNVQGQPALTLTLQPAASTSGSKEAQ